MWFLRAYFVAKLLYWVLNKYCKEVAKNIICSVLFIFSCMAVLLGHGEHVMNSLMALFYISVSKLCKQYGAFEDFKIGNLRIMMGKRP